MVWLANLFIERRIRKITQEAAVNGKPLPNSYRRLFPGLVHHPPRRAFRHDRSHRYDDIGSRTGIEQ